MPAPLPAPAWPRRLGVLLLIAVAARAMTLGSPVVHVDEGFYLAAAHAWAHGAVPYLDVWDRKPIGLFLLYLPAGLAPPWLGVWIYQATALAAAVATAALIARIADRAGWTRGALPAAAAYLLWLDFADGQGGQSPVFYNALMAGAALLAMGGENGLALPSPSGEGAGVGRQSRAPHLVRTPHPNPVSGGQRPALSRPCRGHGRPETPEGEGLVRALAALLLVGLAAQIKYAVVFEGAWFGLWLLGRAWARGRWRAAVPLAAGLALAAALPTVAAFGAYATMGQGRAWLYANFLSILQRGHDPLREQLDNILTAFAILGPPLPAVITGLRAPGAPHARAFLAGWAAAALGGFVVFGSWFNHYTLPVLVPFAACAAGAFAASGWLRRHALALGAVAFLAGQGILLSERHMRGTRRQFARVAQAIGQGRGALHVYSGSSLFYTVSGRPALTRYLFPSHLFAERENGAVGVSQRGETARVLARHPAVVVVQAFDGGERADLHAAVVAWLARHRYAAVGPLPYGDKSVTVWRAPTTSPTRRSSR